MDADRPRSSSKSSPWIWLGCGCGILVALVMAGVTWFGYKAGKKMEKAREDPVAREQMTREVLAFEKPPPGYYPTGAFSIPMLTDIAIFSDRPPEPGEQENHSLGDRGFIFLSMHGWMADKEELASFLEGKAKRPGWLGRSGANTDIGEVLGRGKIEVEGRELLYMATRGDVNMQGSSREGLVTWLTVDCPADRRARLGLWFNPDPAPGKPLQGAALAGTAADPQAIREFARHFRFCG